MVGFIKQNLKLLLRLISADIHNKEVALSATEFNTLRVLFKVHSLDGKALDLVQRPRSAASSSTRATQKQLSAFTPFFKSNQGG
jgi:hypothetical protein